MLKKNVFKILLMVALVIGLVGCQSEAEEVKNEEVVQAVYPMTITDSYDREVTLETEPQTIISIAPNITETIYALGAEDKLVGRTDYCDYPAEVSSVEPIGSLRNPNIEKIVELDPDLVIASTHFKTEVLEKLEEANIKVLVLYGSESFEGVYETINNVGLVLNQKENADKIIANMKTKVETVLEKVKGKEKPSIYYVVAYGESGEYTATKETFIAQMIDMAGGENTANDSEHWKYSIEKLLEKDPEMLICSKYFGAKEGIKVANGYNELTSVKENRLFEIDNNLLDRQGPRLADGLEELAKIIQPEAFK